MMEVGVLSLDQLKESKFLQCFNVLVLFRAKVKLHHLKHVPYCEDTRIPVVGSEVVSGPLPICLIVTVHKIG